jgi:hypothetical protein
MAWSDTDFQRMDDKLDRLVTAMAELAHVEPQIKNVETRIEKLEVKHAETRAELDKWVNRGIGGWALAATVAAGWQMISKAMGAG